MPKKKPMIINSFGVFKNGVLVGICAFGLSGNMNNNKLGEFDIMELNRLCINDNERNCLGSFFLGRVFRLLDSPLVLISYADTEMNHVGYIYQATNWIYTGIDGGSELYCKDGVEIHSKSFSDKFGTRAKSFAESKGYSIKKTTGKHRYFYFIGTRTQKKEMFKCLKSKYQILPYPKGETRRYDASATFPTQQLLF